MRRPPARTFVLATLALLLVSVAGGATAGRLITGKDIKNGSITGKDVKNGTLEAQELSPGARSSLAGSRAEKLDGALTAPSGQGTVSVRVGTVQGRAVTLECANVGTSIIEGTLSMAGVSAPYRSSMTQATTGGNNIPPADSFATGTATGALVLGHTDDVYAFDTRRMAGTVWVDLPGGPLRVEYDLVVNGHANGRVCDVMGLALRAS